jgi:hypothetical protein
MGRSILSWRNYTSASIHIGVEMAQLIRASDGIMKLLQEVPDLSEEEKAVAEGDREMLNKLIEKYKDVAPPPVPNERYIFNPTALPSSRGKMLPVVPLSKEPS